MASLGHRSAGMLDGSPMHSADRDGRAPRKRVRRVRAAVQAASIGLAALVALNAAYLARLTDQMRTPGPFLSRVASLHLFPFGTEAGSLSIEDYCPLGPVEGLARFAQSLAAGRGLSFVGPVTLRNLAFLGAALLLVLVTKKTFCSWLCPFGAVFDALRALGARLGVPAWRPSRPVDRRLRRLRLAVLATLIATTAWAGTLLFKEIDPFYALYSLGSDPRPWPAYLFLAALAAGALAHGGVWCHYLCPLGGLLDPFSRLGRIRLARTDRCTRCGACAAACPQRIPIPRRNRVVDAACTNCLDCLDACPERDALELRLEATP